MTEAAPERGDSPRSGGAANGPANGAGKGAAVGFSAPSLPTGGGAVRGVGEAFATDPMTGTGSLSIPLGLPPGRAGFGPGLSLDYDSGAGNGVFGLGWNLGPAAVSRRTERGLPRYDETDRYVLGGGEELLPGADALVTVHRAGYTVRTYRPRVERDFTLIERWTAANGETFWRALSRDNVTTWYGRTAASRVADPADSRRVFRWLPCEQHDDRGNAITFEYAAEDGRGVDVRAPQERHRTPAERAANRHLKHVRYGNTEPYHPTLAPDGDWTGPGDVAGQSWMFHVVLDYGDHHPTAPAPLPDRGWLPRADPFSTRRPGFELHTYRICRRVLVFHHFPGVPGVGADCLVSSTDLDHDEPADPDDPTRPGHATLTAVTRRCYRRRPPPQTGYDQRQHPPVTLEYSRPAVDRTVRELDPAQLERLPAGLQGAAADLAYRISEELGLTAGHGLDDKVRGTLAIRLISLLRTQLKSDLAIYGATYSGKLNEYERFFLLHSGVNLRSKAWAKAAGLDTWWWRMRRRPAVADRSPKVKPANLADTGSAATEPVAGNVGDPECGRNSPDATILTRGDEESAQRFRWPSRS